MMPSINLPKQNSNQPLQLINQTIPSRNNIFQNGSTASASIWLNSQMPNAALFSINASAPNHPKPPVSLRTRPMSAGNGKISVDTLNQPKLNGWVKGNTSQGTINGRIGFATNEHDNARQNDGELYNRIFQLEKELKTKNTEIKDLNDKVNALQGTTTTSSTTQTMEFSVRSELEQVKRDKSIATGLINTMQKDLTNKDATISKLARDIENIKRELKDRENQIKDLSEKLVAINANKRVDEEKENKEKEIHLLRNKFKQTENKVTELNNQVLQIKNELEESQKKVTRTQQLEKILKDELESLKIQHMDVQRAERTVRMDLEKSRQTYERFRNLIIQAIYSTPGVAKATTELTDENLVSIWKKMIDEKLKTEEKIDNYKEQIRNSENQTNELADSLMQLHSKILVTETMLNKNGRRSITLADAMNSFDDLRLHKNLLKVKDSLVDIYRNEFDWQTSVENSLSSLGVFGNTWTDADKSTTKAILLDLLKNRVELVGSEKAQLLEKYEALNAAFNSASDQRKADGKNESLIKQLEELLAEKERLNVELCQRHSEELEKINTDSQVKFDQLIAEHMREKETNISNSEELFQKLNNLSSELEISKNEINDLKTSLLNANETITRLREQAADEREQAESKIKKIENEKQMALLDYNSELDIHKEQIKQHSITIINLEKEISGTKPNRHHEFAGKKSNPETNSNLERELSQLKQRETDYLHQIDNLKNKLLEKFKDTKPNNSDQSASSYEKTIESLKNDCKTYKNKVSEQDEVIKILRKDLISVSAKLTDTHSELPEKQKREMERNKILLIEQTRDLADNRTKLAKLSEIIDKQNQQVETLKSELSKTKEIVAKYKSSADENGSMVIELKARLEHEQKHSKTIENIKHEEGKIAGELTSIGAQCRGERHEQVIARQKEALNELRQKLKTLEQTRPTVPLSQLQMQQQIILLKKQLAEFRANQALSEDISKQAILASRGDESLLMLHEQTCAYETQSILDSSEETYMALLRSIASMLEMNEAGGLRTLSSLPPDEREKVITERNKDTETICIKIKALKEALHRKEKLLQDYELDLAKLRQTEFLLKKKSEQLDEVQMLARNKEDEVELLQESLKNSRSRLDEEILHNNIIKQKRPMRELNLEKIRRGSTDTLHHHCPPDDIHHTIKNVKKSMNEKIKKKDYELKSLKNELKTKQGELSDVGNRLKMVENGHALQYLTEHGRNFEDL